MKTTAVLSANRSIHICPKQARNFSLGTALLTTSRVINTNYEQEWVWRTLPGCAEEGGEKEGSMGTPPGLVGDGHLNKKRKLN